MGNDPLKTAIDLIRSGQKERAQKLLLSMLRADVRNILYVWLISVGGDPIHQGLRHLVDRHDRRDLCIFQIGLRFIQRRLTNGFSFQVPLCSYL